LICQRNVSLQLTGLSLPINEFLEDLLILPLTRLTMLSLPADSTEVFLSWPVFCD